MHPRRSRGLVVHPNKHFPYIANWFMYPNSLWDAIKLAFASSQACPDFQAGCCLCRGIGPPLWIGECPDWGVCLDLSFHRGGLILVALWSDPRKKSSWATNCWVSMPMELPLKLRGLESEKGGLRLLSDSSKDLSPEARRLWRVKSVLVPCP